MTDAPEEFNVSTVPDGADRATVRVVGEIDVATAPTLVDALTVTVDKYSEVLLDLGSVSFLDSTGLRAVIAAKESASLKGIDLRVSAASDVVEHLLALTGMSAVLGWEPGTG